MQSTSSQTSIQWLSSFCLLYETWEEAPTVWSNATEGAYLGGCLGQKILSFEQLDATETFRRQKLEFLHHLPYLKVEAAAVGSPEWGPGESSELGFGEEREWGEWGSRGSGLNHPSDKTRDPSILAASSVAEGLRKISALLRKTRHLLWKGLRAGKISHCNEVGLVNMWSVLLTEEKVQNIRDSGSLSLWPGSGT